MVEGTLNYTAIYFLIGLLLVVSMGVWDYVRKRNFPKLIELILVIWVIIFLWPVIMLAILFKWVKERSGW
jgi:hypothetical protein